jgi:hypothetical protein
MQLTISNVAILGQTKGYANLYTLRKTTEI